MNFRQLRHTLRSKLGADEDRDAPHICFWLSIDNRDHRVGKISHSSRGSDKVEDHIISDIAKRLRLTKVEFFQLVDCTIEAHHNARLWKERES